jgi:ribosome assembly protein YihI (activator of Der GTPase)
MTFAEEIRERKATLAEARNALTMNTDLLVNALEVRILELESDLDNAHEDLENDKALTVKLKGLLDGKTEMVGELLEALGDIIDSCEIPYCESDPFVLAAKLAIANANGEQP